MKFTLDVEPARAAIAAVYGIVSRKTTIPILTNFRIDAGVGELTLTATDLDMWGSVSLYAAVERPGSLTVSADKMSDIAKSLASGADLTLEHHESGRCTVRSGRSNFTVATLPATDFPMTGEPDSGAARLTISAGELSRLLEVGGSCMGDEASRPYLMCCFLHSDGPLLRVVSTGGHTLAMAHTAAPTGFDFEAGAMIAPKTTAMLTKLLANASHDEAVELYLTPHRLVAEIGRTRLVAKLVDPGVNGYPLYKRLLPSEVLGELRADVDLLTGCVTRARIMAEDGFSVHLSIEPGRLVVRAGNPAAGETAVEETECEWTGEPHGAWVNAGYFLDLLKWVRTEEVAIRIPPNNQGMSISETKESDWLGLLAPQAKPGGHVA